MLLPAIEAWRSKLQGSESPLSQDDEFTRKLLVELNDLSNLLEKVAFSTDLPAIQDELSALMARHKPTGLTPSAKCEKCGRPIP